MTTNDKIYFYENLHIFQIQLIYPELWAFKFMMQRNGEVMYLLRHVLH